MHKIEIPDWATQHVIRKRGRRLAFTDMVPGRTALVVVDLQRGFMDEEVAHSFIPTSLEIVPAVNVLASAVRETGGIVVFVRTIVTEEARKGWSVFYEDLSSEEKKAKRNAGLANGGRGQELWPELDIRDEDLIVEKTRYSAFIQGSSDLEARLRERAIDTVLITGTATNTCCESTARDAMMLNFRTVMISDGNAAQTDAAHNAALMNFYLSFGDVMTAEDASGFLRANAGNRERATA